MLTCESFHDVPIPKLKQVMNKCSTVYFLCRSCDTSIRESSKNLSSDLPASTQVSADITKPAELISSLKEMFNQHVSDVKRNIESLIDIKLGDKLNQIAGMTASNDDNASTAKTYASSVGGPNDLRKIMKEARNEEKLEAREQEQRSNNFIIHGAEEIGDNPADKLKNDKQYILDILEQIRLADIKPKYMMRLGEIKENKGRTIKVEMKIKEDKDKVMNNLKFLKGTEDYFGKIRITDDYTRNERDMIRDMVKKAEAKSVEDPNNTYRVRGNPKNGLHLIRVHKEQRELVQQM